MYPMGMSLVAAAVTRAGHLVRQADMLAWQEISSGQILAKEKLQQELLEFCPQVVGISLRNIDNVDSFTSEDHWCLDKLRTLVASIRQTSLCPIILGGAGFSLMPQAILDYCQADYGIIGEGEKSLPALLALLEQGQKAPQLIQADTRCCGQELLSPLYDAALLSHYAQASGVVNVQSKRGCLKKCLYCTYPYLEGTTIRARDPHMVVAEIKELQRTVAFRELFFTDSVFNDKQGHWLHLVEAMAVAGIVVPWTGFFQPELLSREALALCVRTGLKAVEFGTDATSDITLQAMGKGFDFSSVVESSAICNTLSLPCAHFVIFGGPGESMESLYQGLKNLDRLENNLVFAFLGIRLYKDSPLMRYAVNEGSQKENAQTLNPVYYFSPRIEQQQATEAIAQNFAKKRLRVFPPSQGQLRMQAMRQMGFRGILWDSLIRFKQKPQPAPI